MADILDRVGRVFVEVPPHMNAPNGGHGVQQGSRPNEDRTEDTILHEMSALMLEDIRAASRNATIQITNYVTLGERRSSAGKIEPAVIDLPVHAHARISIITG